MKQTIKMTALFVMLIASLGSCTKGDKGDTGTNGAPGTNGTNGQDGTNGTNGVNGINGNANVHTDQFAVTAANWGWVGSPTYGNYVTLNATKVTQHVLDYGVVSVFYSNGSGGWVAIPFTNYFGTNLSYTLDAVSSLSTVTLWLFRSDYVQNSAPYTTSTFKVVAIDGSLKQSHPHTNWKNYDEVESVINEIN